LGAVLLKPNERLLIKKMPLGPQFAQGLNRGIKTEYPIVVLSIPLLNVFYPSARKFLKN